MTDKAQYILYSILDFGLTFGGTAGVIVYNYITPTNPLGYKLTLGGIILLIALVLTAKAIFEKHYREKYDTMLQQLAEATDPAVKQEISDKINEHKIKNNVYQRLMLLLPFMVLYLCTWLGATAFENLQASVGLILVSMGIGSVFNVIKKPVRERMNLAKTTAKAQSKAQEQNK